MKNEYYLIDEYFLFVYLSLNFLVFNILPKSQKTHVLILLYYTALRNRRAMSMRLNVFIFVNNLSIFNFFKCFLVNIVDHFDVQLRMFFIAQYLKL